MDNTSKLSVEGDRKEGVDPARNAIVSQLRKQNEEQGMALADKDREIARLTQEIAELKEALSQKI